MAEMMSREQQEKLLDDIRWEPEWRGVADRECEYYDGNQLDSHTLIQMRDRGVPPLVRNLVGPTIDVVLGMEAKSRRDWKVTAEYEKDADMAEALNMKLKQAERTSRADRACSDAYAGQIKVGLGWVEVSRHMDPMQGRYRVTSPHRREMYYDWRDQTTDDHESRYTIRRRWFDVDRLKLMFPRHTDVIDRAFNLWADWDVPYYWQHGYQALLGRQDLVREYEAYTRMSLEELEWRQYERQRMALYEVWYRTWKKAVIMLLQDDSFMEYDQRNPRHVQVVGMGIVRLQPALISKARRSFWIGPHMVADQPSPYPHNKFPYVKFWGMREDKTGVPYGLIRRMMSPQDEVNTRLSKMMWLLSAKRIIADEDAVQMDVDELLEEAGRPDAYIPLNKNRRNRGSVEQAIRIESDFQLSKQQFDVMKDATVALQDSAGVYQAMLGKETVAESGVAINSLVEQGSTTLAEINDNYRYSRVEVGERLLSLVKEDVAPNTPVDIEREGRKTTVVLNGIEYDPETGFRYRTNNIWNTRSKVELEEVPNTPTYKAQQLQQLTELTKALPPEIQQVIIDIVVKATDLPQRHEIADRIRKQLNIGDVERTPEEQERLDRDRALLERGAEAEISEKESVVKERNAKTEETLAKVEKLLSELRDSDRQLGIKERELALKEEQNQQARLKLEVERDAKVDDVNVRLRQIEGDLEIRRDAEDRDHQREMRELDQQETQNKREHDLELRRIAIEDKRVKQEAEQAKADRQAQKQADKEQKTAEAQSAAKTEAEKPLAPVINLAVNAAPGPTKKTVQIVRGEDGSLTGEVTEQPAED